MKAELVPARQSRVPRKASIDSRSSFRRHRTKSRPGFRRRGGWPQSRRHVRKDVSRIALPATAARTGTTRAFTGSRAEACFAGCGANAGRPERVGGARFAAALTDSPRTAFDNARRSASFWNSARSVRAATLNGAVSLPRAGLAIGGARMPWAGEAAGPRTLGPRFPLNAAKKGAGRATVSKVFVRGRCRLLIRVRINGFALRGFPRPFPHADAIFRCRSRNRIAQGRFRGKPLCGLGKRPHAEHTPFYLCIVCSRCCLVAPHSHGKHLRGIRKLPPVSEPLLYGRERRYERGQAAVRSGALRGPQSWPRRIAAPTRTFVHGSSKARRVGGAELGQPLRSLICMRPIVDARLDPPGDRASKPCGFAARCVAK